jgi:hypothetical protein
MGIMERIKEIEAEMARTQKNKVSFVIFAAFFCCCCCLTCIIISHTLLIALYDFCIYLSVYISRSLGDKCKIHLYHLSQWSIE